MINRQKQRANNKFSQIKIIRVFFLKWKFKQGFCVDTRLIKGYVYWLIQRLTIVVLFLVSFHLLFINLQHISVYLNLVFWYDFEPYELKVIAYTWIEYKYDYEHRYCGDKMTKYDVHLNQLGHWTSGINSNRFLIYINFTHTSSHESMSVLITLRWMFLLSYSMARYLHVLNSLHFFFRTFIFWFFLS